MPITHGPLKATACCLLACLALPASPLLAEPGQNAQPRAAGHAALDRLPDWSGVWQPDWSSLFGPQGRMGTPQLTPEAQARLDAFKAVQAEGQNVQGDAANCMPVGMPGIMRMPYPIEFIYSPGRVTIFTETYSQARRIATDGRALPADPEPLFNGTSVGHWEGDTLVVETAGFSPKTRIAEGIEHSGQMRIVERITLEKPGRLMIETTITDPAVLTQPLVTRQAYDRMEGWQIREYVCQENNRDSSDDQGRAGMDQGLEQFGEVDSSEPTLFDE